MIGVHRLCVTLGGREVLRDVSFAAGPGEFVAICGPNGAGKTTLLRGLAGLLPGGQVQPRRVGYLEQGARCAWDLTVAQTVTIGRIPWRDADLALVNVAMRECGVTELAGRRVDTLSGGQGRRVMLARALATQPEALLLDEPIADLDPRACHDVMRLLAGQAQRGRIVVAVLHTVELAAAYCTRMVVLEAGRVVADAPPVDALAVAAACFGMLVGTDDRVRLMPPP